MEYSPPKRTDENEIFSNDFGPLLAAGETIQSASVEVSVMVGTDANPSAMISGVAGISGSIVSQMLQGGVDGVTYIVLFSITTSVAQILKETRILKVSNEVR